MQVDQSLKDEVGIVSQHNLETINIDIRWTTGLMQWGSNSTVIDWFCTVENKAVCRFTQFDIVCFYPSVTKSLLLKDSDFVKYFTKCQNPYEGKKQKKNLSS